MTGRTGLRRFVGPPEPEQVRPRPAQPVEPCELCGTPAGSDHGHVVDTENRAMLCTCRACYLLFTRPDAGGGRFRAVPRRYLHDPDRPLTAPEWDALGIPVESVFFLRSADGLAAFYPSPAGATECLLDLDAWTALGADHPMLASAEPEVEAILVHNPDRGTGGTVECFLVPVDVCYQLVGVVRAHWQGFDGGPEARARISALIDNVRSKARPFSSAG